MIYQRKNEARNGLEKDFVADSKDCRTAVVLWNGVLRVGISSSPEGRGWLVGGWMGWGKARLWIAEQGDEYQWAEHREAQQLVMTDAHAGKSNRSKSGNRESGIEFVGSLSIDINLDL